MGLNSVKGNMYKFITHTWNTVKGRCPHDCSYCYMKSHGPLRPVRFDEKELNTDPGENNFIFVGSSCDMWAANIPAEWVFKTLTKCRVAESNRYLYQSKNPGRILIHAQIGDLPFNSVVGTTIETDLYGEYEAIMGKGPAPVERAASMLRLRDVGLQTFVTIEPIMRYSPAFIDLIESCKPNFVNIGADSKGHNLPEPSPAEIRKLISGLKKFTQVNMKVNLSRILGDL